MKKLLIEKLEGQYYFCKDKEKNYFAIETAEMPKDAKVGSRIIISDDGIISIEERRK